MRQASSAQYSGCRLRKHADSRGLLLDCSVGVGGSTANIPDRVLSGTRETSTVLEADAWDELRVARSALLTPTARLATRKGASSLNGPRLRKRSITGEGMGRAGTGRCLVEVTTGSTTYI
jgi:hypothetical protein